MFAKHHLLLLAFLCFGEESPLILFWRFLVLFPLCPRILDLLVEVVIKVYSLSLSLSVNWLGNVCFIN